MNTDNKKQTCKDKRRGWCGSKWITKHKRLAIYIRDNFICCYCGEDLRNKDRQQINLDHIIPRSQDGTNDATNLITACKSCNSSRQDKRIEDYATGVALERIERFRVKPLNIALAKALILGTTGEFDR